MEKMLIKSRIIRNEQEEKSVDERLTAVEEELTEIKQLIIEIRNDVRELRRG